MSENRMKFFYLRDKRKRPVAIVAYKDHIEHSFPSMVGWAVATCNPADRFSKTMARIIVAGRLSDPKFFSLYSDSRYGIRHAITTAIAYNFDRAFPDRASKVAKLWLRNYSGVPNRG